MERREEEWWTALMFGGITTDEPAEEHRNTSIVWKSEHTKIKSGVS
jgi:hypothetical protein